MHAIIVIWGISSHLWFQHGHTPLHEAAQYNRADVAKLLVISGADVHAEDSAGRTPLSLATDPALKADMVFLTRRPPLLFFEAVIVSDDVNISRSFRQVAENSDLMREVYGFL